MQSLVLGLSTQQPPGQQTGTLMLAGAAVLLLLAIRAFIRAARPMHVVLRAAAELGLTVLFTAGALALVVLSLVA